MSTTLPTVAEVWATETAPAIEAFIERVRLSMFSRVPLSKDDMEALSRVLRSTR